MNEVFYLEESLKEEDYIFATYYLETFYDPYKAAKMLALEQSTGTWLRVGKETDELRQKHSGKVVSIYVLPEDVDSLNLPTREKICNNIKRVLLKIAFPISNFLAKIPNLFSCVAGNLFEMSIFTAVKLLDIKFPESYLSQFQGPKFGISGTREILGVYKRPLLGAIVKPCVGLSPKDLSEIVYEGAKGGLDFIKDDELLADTDYNPLKERVKYVISALKRAEDETGEKKMYAFNITDEVGRIKELHDIVVSGGGNCVMINAATAGLSALRELASYTEVPIHCHRDFAPCWSRSEYIGISASLMTKIFRICGADQIHIGAISGKLYETDNEVVLSALFAKRPLFGIKSSFPVSSGGLWAKKVSENMAAFSDNDFLMLAGGGVFGHPLGPCAGAKSMRQAIYAAMEGIPIEKYAKEHIELKKAIEHFSQKGGS